MSHWGSLSPDTHPALCPLCGLATMVLPDTSPVYVAVLRDVSHESSGHSCLGLAYRGLIRAGMSGTLKCLEGNKSFNLEGINISSMTLKERY